MSTPGMITLAMALHASESMTPDELAVEATRTDQQAQYTSKLMAQQGNAALQNQVQRLTPGMIDRAARLQGKDDRQANALLVTASILSTVADASAKVMARVEKGEELLPALLDSGLVALPGTITGKSYKELNEAVQIARQALAFSRDPDLYGGAKLVNTVARTLGRYANIPAAQLASRVILPVVAQAMQMHGNIQEGRARAFQSSLSALARSARKSSGEFKTGANAQTDAATKGAFLYAAQVMAKLEGTCLNLQNAVTGGRDVMDVLSDNAFTPDAGPVKPARVALTMTAKDADPESAAARTLKLLNGTPDGGNVGRDVFLTLIREVAREGDTSTSKYLIGTLKLASSALRARRAQLLEEKDRAGA